MTGSIGVYTINFREIGYLATSKEDFFARLKKLAILGKNEP
jgi:anaerobic ribonucleoside-triphosphate reductase